MNSTVDPYLAAIETLEHAVGDVLSADVVRLSPTEVAEALGRIERVARRLAAVQTEIAAAAEQQGVPGQLGCCGLKLMLERHFRLTGGEAAARVAAVRNRAARVQPSGAVCPPRHPILAAAQRAGQVSERHAHEIEKVLAKARRAGANEEVASLMEDILVDAALDETPHALLQAGRYAMTLLDAQGQEPDGRRAAAERGIELGAQHDDTLASEIGGVITAPLRALLEAVFAKWARPGVNNLDDPAADRLPDGADSEAVDAAAARDHRAPAQRRHDALLTALRAALDSGALGTHRGLPAIPIVTLTLEQVESELGVATTATGGRIAVQDAIEILAHHPRYVVLLDAQSRPLWLGRQRRLASADQRIALIGAEHGCTAPGCDSAAAYCEVHHLRDWAAGGTTDIENLTLACGADHHSVAPADADATGWRTRPAPPGHPYSGRALWKRGHGDPGHVNHRHHPHELYAEAVARWERHRDEALAEHAARAPGVRSTAA